MNFNGPPSINPNEQKTNKKETSRQLRLAVEIQLHFLTRKVSIEGKGNLNLIPKNKKVIIASSHISDADMQLAIKALSKDLDIVVSGKSTNSATIIGKRNYLPIDYSSTEKSGSGGTFNPENYDQMQTALDSNKSVLIAAHSPSWGTLPEKGGKGAAYLAQMGDYIILPVASDYQTSEPYQNGKNDIKMMIERAPAKVMIGKPIEFPKIEGFAEYEIISAKRFRGEKLTDEETAKMVTCSQAIARNSEIIMQSLVDMLPKEKRGNHTAME